MGLETLSNQTARARISFPAVKYFEPRPKAHRRFTQILVRDWDEAFTRNHNHSWPRYEDYVPGGLLDHRGLHFKIVGLRNWRPPPWYLAPFELIRAAMIFYRRYELDPILEGPEQLTLDAFKERLCKLVGRERGLHSGAEVGYRGIQQRIRAAPDYERCIFAIYNKAMYSDNRV